MEWEIDKLLQHPEPLRMPEHQAAEFKLNTFKQIFAHHYENCPEYRKYCELYNITPYDIKSLEDLIKMQPIPSDAFRGTEKLISSVPKDKIVMVATTSSTTSKTPCRYPLDADTLRRTAMTGIRLLKDLGVDGTGFMCMLTPSPDESDTGLVRGMSHWVKEGMKYGDRVMYFVKHGKMETEAALNAITSTHHRPIHMFGPPFAYMHLADYIEKHGIEAKLDKDSRLLMSGGWKTVAGEVTRLELNERLVKAFHIRKDQIRDGLGLTDIYTMIAECEFHNKHTPPWIHVSARDPTDMNVELGEGEEGILVLMSSFITSFPAIVASGDMGAVWNRKKCECGRHGQIVEHRGRGSKLGARGCAIRLEQFMEIITRK